MKKILIVILGAMLVLSFAASAFAIHAEIPSETQAVVAKGGTQITLGGELRMRGWYFNNMGTAQISDGTATASWVDTDNDGVVDANEATTVQSTGSDLTVSPTMYLPTNQTYVGSSVTTTYTDLNDLSTHVVGATSRTEGDSNSDAWYDARVRLTLEAVVTPNTKGYVALESSNSTTSDVYGWGTLNQKQSNLNILEAWILHTGSGLLGIPAGIKVGHMPLALGEKQFLDLTKFGSDAIVLFADPVKGWHIGLLTAKVAEGSNSVNDDIDAYVALTTYKINDNHTIGANYTLIKADDLNAIGASNFDITFHNWMLHAKGKAGPISYRAEADYQIGDILGNGTNTQIEGWGVFAELGVKIDPVSVHARYAYGTGDKGTEDKNEDFQTILGKDIHSTFIHEYMIDGAASNQLFPSGSTTAYRSRGIANTQMYNLGASMSPAKDLTVQLDAFYLRANTSYRGLKNPMSASYGTTNEGSREIGVEADLRLTYKIDRNLTYNMIAGVFKPGKYYTDAYDMYEMGIKKTSVSGVMHHLTLSF